MQAYRLGLLLAFAVIVHPIPLGDDISDMGDDAGGSLLLLKLIGSAGMVGDYDPTGWPTPDQFANAAGWTVGHVITDRRPVLFVPPFSGVRLVHELHERPIRTPMDIFCKKNTNGFEPLWLPNKRDAGLFTIRCVVENMGFGGVDIPVPRGMHEMDEQEAPGKAGDARSRSTGGGRARHWGTGRRTGRHQLALVNWARQEAAVAGRGGGGAEAEDVALRRAATGAEEDAYPPKPGVLTRFDDSFDAAMYLDEQHTAPVYGVWAKVLTMAGWTEGLDMDAVSYDWRKGPDAYEAPGGAFEVMKGKIEALVEQTGKKVVVVSMSMGGPLFALFCHRYVSSEWKDAHIDSFFSKSGSYGGSTSPLFSILTGAWGKIIPRWLQSSVTGLARSMGSPVWMTPSESVYGKDRVVVRTPSRSYTVGEIGDAMRDAGATRSAAFWDKFQGMNGPMVVPNVTTYCLYGTAIPSPDEIIISAELDSKQVWTHTGLTWGDGDGTVLLPGLEACGGFAKHQEHPVRSFRFPNVTHTDLLKNLDAFRLVATRLAPAAGGRHRAHLHDAMGHR